MYSPILTVVTLSLCAGLSLAASLPIYANPAAATGDINGVHDPTICKVNGTYYLYTTGNGIPIRTSTDRKNWVAAGEVFPNGAPSETDAYTGSSGTAANLWAPDCTYVDGKFYIYYAASSFGSEHSGIFLVSSPNGLTGWSDYGLVTSSASGTGYNAIDPHLFVSGSEWYLSLGSFWSGIKLMTLDPSTGKPASTAVTSISDRLTNGGAEEASWIYETGGYFYLFTSFDKCCDGTSSTYNIRVSRATSITGPYTDQSGVAALKSGGTEILGTHESIYGPGGQSLLEDSDGVLLIYHYYSTTTSILGINRLDFSSGWPVVS
ncbi:glycoside hydrolase family 43 protein [Piloderma croceum F 1598]|uniref:Arabinan endo-1,5-alpha-L-arabinosidase n=1 Tax=Piloderma croceum (strain F 1598) TaxID=765440 RepID=A0A0C3FIW1_PILCF|nr:glycoside hydrolase family 43 protein [Piloderma croceum F 1598]